MASFGMAVVANQNQEECGGFNVRKALSNPLPFVAKETAHVELGDSISYAEDAYDALEDADALALVTEWNEFRKPDWEQVAAKMRQPLVFDGRNIWDPMRVEQHGLEYYGIGRGRRLNG